MSDLIENCIAFGIYPDQEQVEHLSENGFTVCVDLTEQEYSTYTFDLKIRYPIKDTKIPENFNSFDILVGIICNLINSGQKIYIHCMHGRGRSSMTVACVLGKCLKISADQALELVNDAYKKGHGKYSNSTVPPHKQQRKFIRQYLREP